MNNIIIIIIIIALGIASFGLTYWIRNFALRKKIVDIPNERSLHSIPTPKGGGLAIVISWYVGITILFFFNAIEPNLYYALMSGFILMIVSLVDDLMSLKPGIRLLVHFGTSILAFYFLQGLRPFIIPELGLESLYMFYPIVIIGMVWFINLFNFMDGVDGFASLEAVLVSLVIFIFSGNIINLLFIICIAGFLYWNWPRAKIFLGDVGSTQLGFILIVLGIYFHNSLEFSILNWIMLTSPFWFDATFTLYRRWKNKEKLSHAHKKHVYQRFVQAGFSHQKVNFYLIGVNLILVIFIFLYREFPILKIPIFVVALFFYYFITKIVDKKVPFKNKL